jgi:general secretion pathway protein J
MKTRTTARRRRTAARRGAGGFTLVEVLVALTIMAVMAGMAWLGVDGIVRARDASQGRLELTSRLNTVMAQWEQDLASLQDSRVVPAMILFDGATLRLTRRTPDGMQVVAWSLRQGQWTRWTGPVEIYANGLQEDWLRSQQLLGNEINQLRMVSGIAQWQLYFYRGNAWTNAQSTGDVSTTNAALAPTGVRLVLTFAEGSGNVGSITRDVALAPQPQS